MIDVGEYPGQHLGRFDGRKEAEAQVPRYHRLKKLEKVLAIAR
jgi:hypothetical protein